MAVERLRNCEDVRELARELGVTRRCLYKWRTKLEVVEPGEEASRPSGMTIKSPFSNTTQMWKPLSTNPWRGNDPLTGGPYGVNLENLRDWLYQNRLAGM